MPTRPVIVVEDDAFPRMLKALLDPSIEPQRLAALADFFAHDLPDFAGWLAHLRAMAGPLYPADVRPVVDQAALRAQLPQAHVAVTEYFEIGAAELALAPQLKVVQKYGSLLERDALLAQSDWVCIQLPDNPGTRDYLDAHGSDAAL